MTDPVCVRSQQRAGDFDDFPGLDVGQSSLGVTPSQQVVTKVPAAGEYLDREVVVLV